MSCYALLCFNLCMKKIIVSYKGPSDTSSLTTNVFVAYEEEILYFFVSLI